MTAGHRFGWTVRSEPLPITGVLAGGSVGATLARRLAANFEMSGTRLRVCATEGACVVLGDPDDLPWVDGATWLGFDHALYCPTTLTPDVDVELVAAAARRQSGVTGSVVATPSVTFVIADTSVPPHPEQLLVLAHALDAGR